MKTLTNSKTRLSVPPGNVEYDKYIVTVREFRVPPLLRVFEESGAINTGKLTEFQVSIDIDFSLSVAPFVY